MTITTRIVAGTLVVLVAAAGGYYFLGRGSATAPQKAAAPPPPDVAVMEVKRADVPLSLAYSARVAGFRTVEIRSMVSGTIMKREYAEGARVKQGETLFRIDPRPYQAAFDRATAQLAQAKATSTGFRNSRTSRSQRPSSSTTHARGAISRAQRYSRLRPISKPRGSISNSPW
jgi:membrane fusion protein (multidrug efflux system)